MVRKHNNMQRYAPGGTRLKAQLNELGLQLHGVGDKITLDSASTAIERAKSKYHTIGVQDGIRAERYFNHPVELLRIYTFGIYTASCCESGPQTKAVIEEHSGQLAKAMNMLDTRLKTIRDLQNFTENEASIAEIVAQISRIRTLATDYVAAMETGDTANARQARKKLQEIASNHEVIFSNLRDSIESANRRGAKKKDALKYLARLIIKYDRGAGWKTGQKIYQQLCWIEPDSRSDEQAELIERMSRHFIAGTNEVIDSEKRALGELINRTNRKFNDTIIN